MIIIEFRRLIGKLAHVTIGHLFRGILPEEDRPEKPLNVEN